MLVTVGPSMLYNLSTSLLGATSGDKQKGSVGETQEDRVPASSLTLHACHVFSNVFCEHGAPCRSTHLIVKHGKGKPPFCSELYFL